MDSFSCDCFARQNAYKLMARKVEFCKFAAQKRREQKTTKEERAQFEAAAAKVSDELFDGYKQTKLSLFACSLAVFTLDCNAKLLAHLPLAANVHK